MDADRKTPRSGKVTEPAPSAAPRPALEIRLATPADADTLAWLTQELLTFYGLPSRYQRSYMTHAIAKGAFGEKARLQVFLAFDADIAVGSCRSR